MSLIGWDEGKRPVQPLEPARDAKGEPARRASDGTMDLNSETEF